MHATQGLVFEGVALHAVVAAFGTPCWVYGAQTIRARYSALATALGAVGASIRYAVKANDHLAVLKLLARQGAGADVVSKGEMTRALLAGMPPGKIVFSGVGKTRGEIAAALAAGLAQINVESAEEIDCVGSIAAAEGRVAPIALRVNPDVDAGTHSKITTGRAGDKFGIPAGDIPALYAKVAATPSLLPVGLAVHIGSQIAEMAPFRTAYGRIAELVLQLRASGFHVPRIDCGGGLGIAYGDEPGASLAAYAGVLAESFGSLDLEIMVEPGRWLVGPAGLLLARVVLTKQAAPNPFLILDAAMNDLLRPAMYDAWHGILPISPHALAASLGLFDVVGPVCESSDVFARGRALPALAPGDGVAILDCGAYGATMSSTYNSRPLAPQVMVDADRWHVIRRRQPMEEMWHGEIVPAYLSVAD